MATKKNVVSMKQDIPAQIETLKNDVAQLAEALKLQTKATVSEKTAVAKDVTTEKAELVKERYNELSNKAERSIQENPLTSIAIAVGAAMTRDRKKRVVKIDTAAANDPMAKYIPDTIKVNPTVQKLLHQVSESPITATATAVTIGVLLSKEIFEET